MNLVDRGHGMGAVNSRNGESGLLLTEKGLRWIETDGATCDKYNANRLITTEISHWAPPCSVRYISFFCSIVCFTRFLYDYWILTAATLSSCFSRFLKRCGHTSIGVNRGGKERAADYWILTAAALSSLCSLAFGTSKLIITTELSL